jgi:multiple sugar transport system permease protein
MRSAAQGTLVKRRDGDASVTRNHSVQRMPLWLPPSARERIIGYLCLTPWLFHFGVLIVGAMVFSLYLSFVRTDLLTGYHWIGLGNYRQLLFDDPLFPQALKVTAVYSLGAVPLNTALAMLIALLLNQDVELRGAWRTLYYMPSIVSGVAVSIIWAWMFNPRYGLINAGLLSVGIRHPPRWIFSEEWALPAFIIMSLWGAGSNMLMYLAGLQSIPTPLYEAAKVDGANFLRRFWSITLPMLSPTIFFNLIMNVIGSFQIFSQSYIMTQGGPNNATLTMVLFLYRKAFEQFRHGYASAIAWALFVIIMALTALVIKSSAVWVYYEGEVAR